MGAKERLFIACVACASFYMGLQWEEAPPKAARGTRPTLARGPAAATPPQSATSKVSAPAKTAAVSPPAPPPAPAPAAEEPKQEPVAAQSTGPDHHVVFTTGCNAFMQWQTELLLWSHAQSGQPGRITRIVSGCEDKERPKDRGRLTQPGGGLDVNVEELIAKSTNPRLEVYKTPGFKGAKEFPWLNKPYGLKHWSEHGDYSTKERSTVTILDPDQVFLAPLGLGDPVIIKPFGETPLSYPEPKRPIAQAYGIGDGWLRDNWPTKVCGEGAPCTKVSSQDAYHHYAVGPPLILDSSDMKPLTSLWAEYMPACVKLTDGDILADMWAYSMAAANLGMPHEILSHHMVSNEGMGNMEAWQFVDEWDSMSCDHPVAPKGKHYPTLMHYAANYHTTDSKGNKWMWHKGHVPHNILHCNVPIIKTPPDNFFNTQPDQQTKRTAWMICNLYSRMNHMLVAYKTKFCKGDALPFNMERRVRLIQDKTLPCPEGKPHLCWPLAQFEDPLDLSQYA